MGWLIRRLVAWTLAGALIGTLGAAVWHSIQIIRAGYALDAVPPVVMALEVMQLHVAAGIGAVTGFAIGLLGRILRRLRLRLRGLFSRDASPAERVDTDALIRADRSNRADSYLASRKSTTLNDVSIADDEGPRG